jgi:hypothetical protein
MFFCACDVGLRMLDITGASFSVHGLDSPIQNRINLLKHRVDGNPFAASYIEDLAGVSRNMACEQVRLDDVLNVREIARLQAVSVNRGPSILEHGRNEEREDSAVL